MCTASSLFALLRFAIPFYLTRSADHGMYAACMHTYIYFAIFVQSVCIACSSQVLFAACTKRAPTTMRPVTDLHLLLAIA
jgi:hypothetical protein